MSGDGAIKHSLIGGKLHVYRRENSGQWQCSTYLAGKNHRVSTKSDSLAHAKEFAEDWYLGLRGKHAAGALKVEKTFKQAAAIFEVEYEVITEGERSPGGWHVLVSIVLILRSWLNTPYLSSFPNWMSRTSTTP